MTEQEEKDWWADFILGVLIGKLLKGEYTVTTNEE